MFVVGEDAAKVVRKEEGATHPHVRIEMNSNSPTRLTDSRGKVTVLYVRFPTAQAAGGCAIAHHQRP